MKKSVILLICCMLAVVSVYGQNQQFSGAPQPRQGWQGWQRQNRNQNRQQPQGPNRNEQFSPAEYWKQQKEFFTNQASLTQDEADAFFPIYNELQQKKRELNREIRRIMRQEGGPMISEDGSLKAIDAKADVNIKIAELEKEYLQKFKQVLPASKILKIQNAEEQFNSQILKDIQQTRGHQFQQDQNRPQQPQFNPQPNRPWQQQTQ